MLSSHRLCAHKGPVLGLMLFCHHCDIINDFHKCPLILILHWTLQIRQSVLVTYKHATHPPPVHLPPSKCSRSFSINFLRIYGLEASSFSVNLLLLQFNNFMTIKCFINVIIKGYAIFVQTPQKVIESQQT